MLTPVNKPVIYCEVRFSLSDPRRAHCLTLSATPFPLEKESCLTRETHLTTAEPSSSSTLWFKDLIRKQSPSERRRDHSCLRLVLLIMAKIAREVTGQVISFVGLCLAAVTSGIPMWRVTTYIGANIVTGQIVWDGLWMRCIMQATGQMQCSLTNNLLSLTQDLQAARALVIICLVIGLIGFIVTFIGAKCTSCLKTDWGSANAVITGGVLLIIAAILVLIPVCWSAAVTISDFGSTTLTATQKRELGAAIYIGWGAAAVLLIGGIVLTTSCPPRRKFYPYYPAAPMYPYAPAPPTYTRPVYAPPASQPYTGSGSYAPTKPYAAPATYSPRQYI